MKSVRHTRIDRHGDGRRRSGPAHARRHGESTRSAPALAAPAASALALAAPAFRARLRAPGAPIRIGFPVPLTGAFGAEAQDQVRAAQLAIAEFNEARRPPGPQRRAPRARRQAQPRRGRDPHARAHRERQGQLHRRRPLGGRPARRSTTSPASASVHLQLDQPVRRDQRGQGFQPLHLPRGPEPAHDRGRGRPLRLPEIRQEGRLPHAPTTPTATRWSRGFKARRRAPRASRSLADIRHPIGATDFSTLLPRIQSLKPDVLVPVQLRPRPADRASSRRPISA